MTPTPKPVPLHGDSLLSRAFAGLLGGFLGLSLLKFGNPPIMEKWVTTPTNVYEFLLGYPWPIAWAYLALGLITVFGLSIARWEVKAPRWLIALPLAWVIWQLLAATQTLDAQLTRPTLQHFAACVICFYLGFFSLSRVKRLSVFWLGLLGGLLLVFAVGWEQHFGGLEQTRRYFFAYIYSQLNEVPPEYLKKIRSDRIFSTLFYPNALAGALLLLLPAALAVIGQARKRFTAAARGLLIGLVAAGGLACLYWSGSKGGWLLMLLLGLIALLRLPFGKPLKIALVTAVLLAGLAGFFWKYSAFFEKGATSVSARFDYWQAAVRTARAKPLFGTGPGTFAIPYLRIKRPESEMSRLVHNDYLEQASDSGVPGLLVYALFVFGALGYAVRRFPLSSLGGEGKGEEATVSAASADKLPKALGSGGGVRGKQLSEPQTPEAGLALGQDWLTFSVWLGVLGWALQSFFEFSLYIPALTWPAFTFLGLLLGRSRNRIDKAGSPR